MLTSSTQLQNRSFHVVERTRKSSKCQKMKNARAKRAKLLFFIVKYANLWGSCCRRRRGCLSSLLTAPGSVALSTCLKLNPTDAMDEWQPARFLKRELSHLLLLRLRPHEDDCKRKR